ncbi:MAG: SCO family protein [Balneolaceae bacterium]
MKTTIAILFLVLMSTATHAQHGHQNHNALKAEDVKHSHSLYHLDAEWTDHRGEKITLSRFSGEPVIVVMFYGNCTEVCPILIQDAWRLYSSVSEDVRAVVNVIAVTFDPENDTPSVLKQYAEYEQLDIPGWHFVTAEPAEIRELAMLLGVQFSQKSDRHFSHSNLVTVLDGEGKIARRVEGLGHDMKHAAEWINEHFKQEIN